MNAISLVKVIQSTAWDCNLWSVDSALSRMGGKRCVETEVRFGYELEGVVDVSVYRKSTVVEAIEFTTESFTAVSKLSELEYEDKVDEYFSKYQALVADTARVFGSPIFDDGAAAPGFPQDQDAVWLAEWKLPTARLMIEQKHEDRELPFRLCIVVCPNTGC